MKYYFFLVYLLSILNAVLADDESGEQDSGSTGVLLVFMLVFCLVGSCCGILVKNLK